MKLPSNPTDREICMWWTLCDDGVIQTRATYYVNEQYAVVTRERGFGVPFEKDWYIENRYINPAGVSEWRGVGRNPTPAAFEFAFVSFDKAREEFRKRTLAHVERMQRDIERYHCAINTLAMFTSGGPP